METKEAEKVGRTRALKLMADLLLAIYSDRLKIPSNVAQYATHNPLKAIGLIVQRQEMPTNNQAVADIMAQINPDDLDFKRPANLQERAEFELRLYRAA